MIKKNSFHLFLFNTLLFLFYTPQTSYAQTLPWSGNINVTAGFKFLDQNDWSPAENQTEMALEGDLTKPDWPLHLVLGFRGARGTGTFLTFSGVPVDMESQTSELSFGFKRIGNILPNFHPFLGGGFSWMEAEATLRSGGVSISDSGSTLGIWLDLGGYWTLPMNWNVGLNFRFSKGSIPLYNVNLNSGGDHLGLLFGYHF